MVETSISRGTLASAQRLRSASSAAHMIGSAAFFAPETCTVAFERPAAGDLQLIHAAQLPRKWLMADPGFFHSSGVSVCIESAWISSRMRSPSAA